jgi:hypothetical protein
MGFVDTRIIEVDVELDKLAHRLFYHGLTCMRSLTSTTAWVT